MACGNIAALLSRPLSGQPPVCQCHASSTIISEEPCLLSRAARIHPCLTGPAHMPIAAFAGQGMV